jgi:hypothetical protein
MVVQELQPGALAVPVGLSEVWRDKGSGADRDVRIFRMNPRHGYTCLGYIAINSYSALPDKNKYR